MTIRRRQQRKGLLVFVITAISLTAMPVFGIYRCEDESGHVSFTDFECANGEELSLDIVPSKDPPPPPKFHPPPNNNEPEQADPIPDEVSPAASSTFSCGDIRIHSFTPYQNLTRSGYGSAIAQWQCAKIEFSLRSGLVPRLNIQSFAEQVGKSLKAVMQDGTTRVTDIAELPARNDVDRFRAHKRHNLHICFGENPFAIVDIQCR